MANVIYLIRFDNNDLVTGVETFRTKETAKEKAGENDYIVESWNELDSVDTKTLTGIFNHLNPTKQVKKFETREVARRRTADALRELVKDNFNMTEETNNDAPKSDAAAKLEALRNKAKAAREKTGGLKSDADKIAAAEKAAEKAKEKAERTKILAEERAKRAAEKIAAREAAQAESAEKIAAREAAQAEIATAQAELEAKQAEIKTLLQPFADKVAALREKHKDLLKVKKGGGSKGGTRGPRSSTPVNYTEESTITVSANAKTKPGSNAEAEVNLLRTTGTVKAFLEAGGKRAALKYFSERGVISFG